MRLLGVLFALAQAGCYDPVLGPGEDAEGLGPPLGRPGDRTPAGGLDAEPGLACPVDYLPSPWGSCYRVALIATTWLAAESDCEDDPGPGPRPHLVVLDSLEEDLAVFELIDDDQWIGLHRPASTWGWVSATPLAFTNWASDEPSGEGPCAEMKQNGDGDWDDESCDNTAERRTYVCEFDGIGPVP